MASANNKRIAKNTLMLYIRMLLIMAITLYTNRVILEKLGVTDYGIYNVVGGIVAMLAFLSGSMSISVQRYLTYEIGKGDKARVNRIFNVSFFAHGCIALIVLTLMECGGLLYLNRYMNIPPDRLEAANWVMQCTLMTTLFSIMQVPYNALIISKEEMGVYAYISILEVVLKLLVVYILSIGNFDKLKLYAILTMVVSIGVLSIYRIYCIRKFEEAKLHFVRDWPLFKEMISFSGWNMLSEIAWAFTGPGVNLILNSFFGSAINAARGLAEQVNGAVSRFVGSFQTAASPQLTKLYAQGENEEMTKLLFRSTRFSFYILLVLSLPLITEMDFILHLWLKEVPEYTTAFCQLVLVSSLVSVNSTLLPTIARAYGKIRDYQIIVSLVLFLNFPLSYIVLKLGYSPMATTYVAIVVQILVILVRISLLKKMVGLSVRRYFKEVIFNVWFVALLSTTLAFCFKLIFTSTTIFNILVMITSMLSACGVSYLIGMDKQEKIFIKNLVNKAVKH